MIYIVVALCLLFLLIAEVIRSDEHDLIRASVLALSKFVLVFCLITIALLAFNHFKYRSALIFEMSICALYCAMILLEKKEEVKIIKPTFALKAIWIPIIICSISIPFTTQRAEYYGMGQDEGVYQTEAIVLASGHTSLYSYFDEYKILKTSEEKQEYLDYLDSLGGYNRLEKTLYRNEYRNKKSAFPVKNSTAGTYHGIHAYSALLGLWIKMTDVKSMTGLSTVLHIVCILLFFFILQNLNISKILMTGATLLYALSPLLIWLSKTCYSESLVILAFLIYLYYLSKPEKNADDIRNIAIASVYICSTHIMFLVLYPAFWLVNIIMAVCEKKRNYSHLNTVLAIGQILLSIAFSRTALSYYFDNLSRLYFKSIITIDNILFWIVAGVVISTALNYIIIRVAINVDISGLKTITMFLSRLLIVICILATCMKLYKQGSGMVEQNVYNSYEVYASGMASLFYTSLWAITLFCGLLVFPYIIWKVFSNKTQIEKPVSLYISVLFMWFVFFYSALLKSEIWYYFYYSRYLGYVVPVVLLFFAILVNDFNEKKAHKFFISSIIAVSLVCMLMLDIPITKYRDDTFVEWNTLKSIAEGISSDDALILGTSVQLKYSLALDSMTGAGVFPIQTDVDNQKRFLQKHYDTVLILAEDNEANAILGNIPDLGSIEKKIKNTYSYSRLHFIGGINYENISDAVGITLIKCNN